MLSTTHPIHDIKEQIVHIIGMPRAGTTFLYHNLQKHPDIFIPHRKELGFFYYNKYRGYDWYYDIFSDIKESQIGFDISPQQFYEPESWVRIKENNSKAKAILIIRNPVEWLYSVFVQYKSYNYSNISFDSFHSNKHIDFKYDGQNVSHCFKPGMISENIKQILHTFNNDVMLIDFSLFNRDPLRVLQHVEQFSGVNCFFNKTNFTNKKINSGTRNRIKLFENLLQHKWFINVIESLFPKNIIQQSRNYYDKKTASNKANSGLSDDLRRTLQEKYIEDIEFINELHKKGIIINE